MHTRFVYTVYVKNITLSADDGLIERWNALPEWPQMLLRALMFRLAVHALHPRSTAAAFPGLARTAALVRLLL